MLFLCFVNILIIGTFLVSVGVGALAGSTIMLLTIPWFLSIVAGRVDMIRDSSGKLEPNYKKSSPTASKLQDARLSSTDALFKTGVSLSKEANEGAKIMLISAMAYLIIQGPAFTQLNNINAATNEKIYAIVGLVVCVILFCAYIVYQMKYASIEAVAEKAQEKAIKFGIISLSGIFYAEFQEGLKTSGTEEAGLLPSEDRQLKVFLRKKFNEFDNDKNGHIDSTELRKLLSKFNEHPTNEEFKEILLAMDKVRNIINSFKSCV